MLRLLGIVVTIGIADSLNPSTIAPALYLASGQQPRERVLEFTAAVFAVYFTGGLVIALGPGQLLLALIPKPSPYVTDAIEVTAGIAMITASFVLWTHRNHLAQRQLPQPDPRGRSSWILGASITAVELPTAFPYFAAIAAIVGSGMELPQQVFLLLVFNVCFVLPLLAIGATLWIAGEHAEEVLARVRAFLQRNWPLLLSMAALVAGLFVTFLGATAFAAAQNGDVGTAARTLRHLLHLHNPPPVRSHKG
jgi:cytochrome c biogenesis protein CcdA